MKRAYQRMKNEAAFGHEECGKEGAVCARFASFFMAAQPLHHVRGANASLKPHSLCGFSCFYGEFLI